MSNTNAGGMFTPGAVAAPAAIPPAMGLGIQVVIDEGGTNYTTLLFFGPEHIPNARQIIAALKAGGFHVKGWQERPSGYQGGGGGYNNNQGGGGGRYQGGGGGGYQGGGYQRGGGRY